MQYWKYLAVLVTISFLSDKEGMERKENMPAMDTSKQEGKLTVHSQIAVRNGSEKSLDQNLSDIEETSRVNSHSTCL